MLTTTQCGRVDIRSCGHAWTKGVCISIYAVRRPTFSSECLCLSILPIAATPNKHDNVNNLIHELVQLKGVREVTWCQCLMTNCVPLTNTGPSSNKNLRGVRDTVASITMVIRLTCLGNVPLAVATVTDQLKRIVNNLSVVGYEVSKEYQVSSRR